MDLPVGSASLTTLAKPIGCDIKIQISSPSEGMFTITANGWVVLPFTEEQKRMVWMAVLAYKLVPRTFNQLALQRIRKLQYSYSDVEITGLDVSQLDWDDSASKLTFGVSIVGRSTKLRELLKELPIHVYTKSDGISPLQISEETIKDMRLDFQIKCTGKRLTAEFEYR